MSQIHEIVKAQQSLEDLVTRKMDELHAQLNSGSAKDTVAKVAEEFRTFRELTFSMLGLLRKQISECSKAVDIIESRSRRKTLIFSGVPEQNGENCLATVGNIIHDKLGLLDIPLTSLKACHRLGSSDPNKLRPILVKFPSYDTKTLVWRAKTKLKGTPIAVKEFLTKARQAVFGKARLHFGVRACWTQDGVVVIKTTDGKRHRVLCLEDLQPLVMKYPKAPSVTSSSVKQ